MAKDKKFKGLSPEENQVFIVRKIEEMKELAKDQQDPVFIVGAKFMGVEKGMPQVKFTSFFMSDNNEPMDKDARMVILNYLEQFISDEKKTL